VTDRRPPERRLGSVGRALGARGDRQHALGPGLDLIGGRYRDALLGLSDHCIGA